MKLGAFFALFSPRRGGISRFCALPLFTYLKIARFPSGFFYKMVLMAGYLFFCA
jgi:hypothetical protein